MGHLDLTVVKSKHGNAIKFKIDGAHRGIAYWGETLTVHSFDAENPNACFGVLPLERLARKDGSGRPLPASIYRIVRAAIRTHIERKATWDN